MKEFKDTVDYIDMIKDIIKDIEPWQQVSVAVALVIEVASAHRITKEELVESINLFFCKMSNERWN